MGIKTARVAWAVGHREVPIVAEFGPLAVCDVGGYFTVTHLKSGYQIGRFWNQKTAERYSTFAAPIIESFELFALTDGEAIRTAIEKAGPGPLVSAVDSMKAKRDQLGAW